MLARRQRRRIDDNLGEVIFTKDDEQWSNDDRGVVTFTTDDEQGVEFPHNDALVISVKIEDFVVRRVLVTTGSSLDIITWDCLQKMNLPDYKLRPSREPIIYGFGGQPIVPEGIISLLFKMGDKPPACSLLKVDCVVVKVPSAYNVIIGIPTLNALEAAVHVRCLKINWWTENGIAECKGDQRQARKCVLMTLSLGGQGSEGLVNQPARVEDQVKETSDLEMGRETDAISKLAYAVSTKIKDIYVFLAVPSTMERIST